jgi:type IV secretory pathway VirB2 component (pilin)
MKVQNERVMVSKKQASSKPVIVGVVLMMISGVASAQAGDALGDGICELVKLLTGKWLFGFTILATLGAGAALLFGGEITDGLKKIATIISIVGIILATASILSLVFGSLVKAC